MNLIYLDYAAATPMDPQVVEAMAPYYTQRFYNPSAPYAAARAVRAEYEDARARLAHLIGARPAQITLTAGATEANNLAFAAVEGHVIVPAIEHESVLACAQTRDCTIVGVGHDGRVDPEAIRAAIRPDTQLVSIAQANGEIGCIQPVHDIALAVRQERARRLEAGSQVPIWLHVDASQAASTLTVNVASLGADMLTLSAAKVYGPKQVGLLWTADGVRLRPLLLGGGQENGVRSGTENVAGVVGFARALELAVERRTSEARRLAKLRDNMQRTLGQEFPQMVVNGPTKPRRRLPGLLSISFPGIEGRRLVIDLEERGVCVGTGSACAASKMQSSHVLVAIGQPAEVANGSLRISMGAPTTEQEVAQATQCIIDAVHGEYERKAALAQHDRMGE